MTVLHLKLTASLPLVAHAFEILNHAAHDIPDSEDHIKGANQ